VANSARQPFTAQQDINSSNINLNNILQSLHSESLQPMNQVEGAYFPDYRHDNHCANQPVYTNNYDPSSWSHQVSREPFSITTRSSSMRAAVHSRAYSSRYNPYERTNSNFINFQQY